MEFALPHALWLVIPAGFAWWRWLRTESGAPGISAGSGQWLRIAVLLLLVIAGAGPRLTHGRGGSDVVVVLDRSASLDDARTQQPELLRLIGDQRRAGDRLGVVSVAASAYLSQIPRSTGLPETAVLTVPDDGSDLAAGLRTARSLIEAGRSARIVLISDGEDTGVGLRAAAAGCAQARIPVDVLPVVRPGGVDAAVLDIELPGELRLGESFVGAARLMSDVAERRTWRVLRGDVEIAHGTADLRPLQPLTITFADRPSLARLTDYAVELEVRDDRRPANNRAVSALRISGGERVLVVGGDGSPGNLSRALTAAGMRVQTRAEGPLELADLIGVTALVLEQVPADRLGHAGLEAVAQWVEHLGGGLVLTGGRRGFGAGGYHRSAVERVSPVTMEIRDEQRKLAVAMVITMDRSGSMGAPAGPGKTKMDLADEGACAALELLGPNDQIAVHAVDSTAHPIIALTRVGNQRSSMVRAVRGIRSEGGGIYTYTALLAAGAELAGATAGTKHLVLFADANDAEEPGDYIRLLKEYQTAGISVSVVAMGTPADSDAKFLEDVAKRGGGRITFATDPADIPRLFAQETVLVSRTAWIDQALTPEPQAALELIVPGLTRTWPMIAGYNLTYSRPRAQVLAWCAGDPAAPAAAAWRIGAGRSVALPFDCDDAKSPAMTSWPGYASFITGAVRWAAGGSGGDAPGAVSVTRSGRTAVVRLELDPKQAPTAVVAPHLALVDAGGADVRQVAFERVDDLAWEARVTLTDSAVLPAALVEVPTADGGRQALAISGPALRLPMNPEVEPRYGRVAGLEVLQGIARDSGGKVRADVVGIYDNPPSVGTGTDLALWLVLAAVVLLLSEIATRRWQLDLRLLRGWWPNFLSRPWTQTKGPRSAPAVGPSAAQAGQARPTPKESSATPAATAAPAPSGATLHDALAELKRRKGR